MASDIVARLKKLESDAGFIERFSCVESSSWIAIKNLLLQTEMIEVKEEYPHKRQLASLRGLMLILRSSIYYFLKIFKFQKKSIFLGASSGLFFNNGQILDSYFPYSEVDPKSVFYMLNCADFDHLTKMKSYFRNHKIVMENFLVGPIKVILGRLWAEAAWFSSNKQLDAAYETMSREFRLSKKALYLAHYKFIAGNWAFRIFFAPLRMNNAYVVSAYTKSDLVSALKRKGVHVTEIQHGFVGRSHPGYNYNLPQGVLPTPDEVFVYNEFWKDELARAGYYQPAQIKITGRLKYDLVEKKAGQLEASIIVFTGQGAFYNEISQFFKESDAELGARNIQLIYKAHPRETSEDLANLAKAIAGLSNVSIYQGEHGTEFLIKNSLAHISIFSSCHFDAIHFLNKTFILDVMKDNFLNPYCLEYPDQYLKISKIDEVIRMI
ncbi:hypothetical protein [Bdellovibrio svalbardensis]|uniref:Capsule biosynthesis protein n=1 Tax=Bdellovibrio svalbardensis TaxID=2972972 RepID=A0ABT6DKF5_9BACT|nr:hypothetical protein [Bdellovibrio svalbardensis]MDG0817347.1 hypothetical protein [Bdellovibrio svalbardensis]